VSASFRLPLGYTAVRVPPGRRNGITKWRVHYAQQLLGVLYRKEGKRKETWGWEPRNGTARIFATGKEAAQAATERTQP
jgi:hypothetical protein